jgi:hypothetical protein
VTLSAAVPLWFGETTESVGSWQLLAVVQCVLWFYLERANKVERLVLLQCACRHVHSAIYHIYIYCLYYC